MITFSADPKRAENEMHAVIFYLVTFGYIDGDFDDKERGFVKDTIRTLIDHRAQHLLRLRSIVRTAQPAATPRTFFPHQDAQFVAQLEHASRLLVVPKPNEIHAHPLHQPHLFLDQRRGHRRRIPRMIFVPMGSA